MFQRESWHSTGLARQQQFYRAPLGAIEVNGTVISTCSRAHNVAIGGGGAGLIGFSQAKDPDNGRNSQQPHHGQPHTDSIKKNRPGYNMPMYWTDFWQPIVHVQYNKIVLKKLLR